MHVLSPLIPDHATEQPNNLVSISMRRKEQQPHTEDPGDVDSLDDR